jgi:U3 small nucleolar RNA-associated protein 7
MTQNPWNAVLLLGHTKGCVTMWSPNASTPLVKMICHRGPVTALAADPTGTYMATSGADSTVKVWDLRALKSLASYSTRGAASSLSISQRGLLAVGSAAHVEVWARDVFTAQMSAPYLQHVIPGATVNEVRFCPFEDFLGVGHSLGYTSMVVPGAGEPNYDTYEASPFETKRQRRETEVHRLLEKIPSAMITLEPGVTGTVATEAEVRAQFEEKRAKAAKANTVVDAAGESVPDEEKTQEGATKASKKKKKKKKKKVRIIFHESKEATPLRPKKEAVTKIKSALDIFTKNVLY